MFRQIFVDFGLITDFVYEYINNMRFRMYVCSAYNDSPAIKARVMMVIIPKV